MANKPKWNTPASWCAGCLAPIQQLPLGTTNNPDYCSDCNRKILRSKTTGGF